MNQWQVRDRFLKLYREDKEFRRKVDEIRMYLFNPKKKLDTEVILSSILSLAEQLGMPPLPNNVPRPSKLEKDIVLEDITEIRFIPLPFEETKKYVPFPPHTGHREDVYAGPRIPTPAAPPA